MDFNSNRERKQTLLLDRINHNAQACNYDSSTNICPENYQIQTVITAEAIEQALKKSNSHEERKRKLPAGKEYNLIQKD